MTLSRRDFLKAAAVAPLAYALPAEAQQKPNLFEVLKEFRFIGEDGNPVNIAALATALQRQFVTLSFGFNGCSDICPISINPNLSAIGDINKDTLTSIVINVIPEMEGVEPFRSTQSQFFRQVGLKQPTITLFPTTEKGALSNPQSVALQTRFGMIAHRTDANKHSPKIMLFAPGGAFLDEKLATRPADEFTRDWAAILAPRQRGR